LRFYRVAVPLLVGDPDGMVELDCGIVRDVASGRAGDHDKRDVAARLGDGTKKLARLLARCPELRGVAHRERREVLLDVLVVVDDARDALHVVDVGMDARVHLADELQRVVLRIPF